MFLQHNTDIFDDEDYDDYSLAKMAREIVTDYYGSAMYNGFFAAGSDLIAAEQMSDAKIILEAKRLNLL